jgi:poly(3-hydroxybutyrate) depolymerase
MAMFYQLQDLSRRALTPVAATARVSAKLLRKAPVPGVPFVAAGWELVHRLTKGYGPPSFDIPSVSLDGEELALREEVVVETPFCRLVRFARVAPSAATRERLEAQPKVLLCAPLSGHHATLLRDMVRSFAPEHDVYITSWIDAKEIPVAAGRFGLDEYIEHVMRFIRHLGAAELHVIAVCQPAVPALAAVSLLASAGEPTPRTLLLMGGPIDGRRSPTAVNKLATERPLSWFRDNLVHRVPLGHAGRGRRVYPGFLQLTAFVSMNPKRHFHSYRTYWLDRISGKAESAASHEKFYDEYNAVLDMDADYYLETVRVVFQEHALAKGTMSVKGQKVVPSEIRDTALMTVEGADDDITGAGQTHVALELCRGVPASRTRKLTAEGCGHYGIFSGSKFREAVFPELRAFIAEHHQAPNATATGVV